MKVSEMMTEEVIAVNEQESVREVIKLFIEHQVSGVPIVDSKNKVTGYISDGDILSRIGKHKDFFIDYIYSVEVLKNSNDDFEGRVEKVLDMNVREVGKKKVAKADADMDVEDVAAILGKKKFKKLPVVQAGKLVGIVSRKDVIRSAFQSWI